MRSIFLVLTLIFSLSCSAYELILPTEKNSRVSTNYVFFVGRANNCENILINDKNIYTAPNGAFAHSVKLKDGNNRVIIRSNYNTQIYKFYKTKPTPPKEEPLVEFDIKCANVKNNNTPLRATPIDGGLNRIAHLFQNTTVLVNASKGDFYRVFLSKNNYAWIAKKDVEISKDNLFKPADFVTTGNKTYKNAVVQSISFSKNLPYTIEEKDKEIIFKVFNPEYSDNSVYTLNIPKPEKYKYSISLVNGTYTFKVSEVPQNITDYTIVIDPGHGGTEKGAIGCLGDMEKDINLKIALELEQQLKNKGVNVLLTRSCDGNMSLNDRVDYAKQNNAEIFISIHLNSIGDIPMNIHKNRGTSVYYYNKNSKELAEILHKSIPKTIGTRHDGVRSASFAVIRPSDYIGVLVETAYMTNPTDSVLYTSQDFAKKTAEGIINGIVEFINSK